MAAAFPASTERGATQCRWCGRDPRATISAVVVVVVGVVAVFAVLFRVKWWFMQRTRPGMGS